jgi:hypothetical protein
VQSIPRSACKQQFMNQPLLVTAQHAMLTFAASAATLLHKCALTEQRLRSAAAAASADSELEAVARSAGRNAVSWPVFMLYLRLKSAVSADSILGQLSLPKLGIRSQHGATRLLRVVLLP